MRAAGYQEASSDFTYIRFHDRNVDILERGPEFARVLYHGKTVRVPVSALDEENPGRLNTDMTDYRLPVAPGDEMSLIQRFGDEIYVRKNKPSLFLVWPSN